MKLAKTDRDELYDEIYGMVATIINISESPNFEYVPIKIKAEAIKMLTDDTFHSILRKVTKQRDRVCAISRN